MYVYMKVAAFIWIEVSLTVIINYISLMHLFGKYGFRYVVINTVLTPFICFWYVVVFMPGSPLDPNIVP